MKWCWMNDEWKKSKTLNSKKDSKRHANKWRDNLRARATGRWWKQMESKFRMGKGQVKPYIARQGCDLPRQWRAQDRWWMVQPQPLFAVSLDREVCRTCVRCHCPFITWPLCLLKPQEWMVPLVCILELREVCEAIIEDFHTYHL